MPADIGELADRAAIMDVMIRYGTSVDAREMDRYRSCFTDDVTVVGYGPGAMEGADAYLAYVTDALRNFAGTQHLMGNQVVDLRGDEATARTEVQATHFLRDEPDAIMTLWATYVDEMVRGADGEWRIRRHELVRRGAQRTIDQPPA